MQPQKPSKPAPPPPKGPWEKRGGIPREKFTKLFKEGPFSMPYSRDRGKEKLKKLGGEILNEKFPGFYGRDISGSEIQREIDRLKRTTPKTEVESNARREVINRLEDVKKRAGL